MKVKAQTTALEADLVTPVGLFLNLRTHYKKVMLLESSAYASREDHLSFLAFDSLAELSIKDGVLCTTSKCQTEFNIAEEIKSFMDEIDIEQSELSQKFNCILGYSTFDAVQYFEDISFDSNKDQKLIPHLRYDFYRFLLVFDHYHCTLHLIENVPVDELAQSPEVIKKLMLKDYSTSNFKMIGDEESALTDQEYKDLVTKAKAHCRRGDVFQLVLARRYSQKFEGDEFKVYRALRAINPSPYLFYFDYEDYRIFGSSPEAQIKITNGVAEIHPIAGTYRRTGEKVKDKALADKLERDPKEVAEHTMLVDLARNDLSISTEGVHVESFKEAQYFSHVIHLTSVVKGNLKSDATNFRVFADTFPAGTLSGAPKYKAMELINKYEPHARSFYGGGIGMINFNGDLNHAIIIRSFLSIDKVLHRQAGAGLVIKSDENSELQEVNNKLAALKEALLLAEKINTNS